MKHRKGKKPLKEVAYKVVYDEQNHTTVSFATRPAVRIDTDKPGEKRTDGRSRLE